MINPLKGIPPEMRIEGQHISVIPNECVRRDPVAACPMKEGHNCRMKNENIVKECNCKGCIYWVSFFNNPWDGFLSRSGFKEAYT